MSVIIRLQNLPWSANALDIRNFFRGLSIPEGGVHIVGGELGDAFIAFSTDEDARQAMMLDGGKLKEIQVKLLLSSRSEMHKVIELARQSVPPLSLQPQAPPAPVSISAPTTLSLSPYTSSHGSNSNGLPGLIPGLGNPKEIPQPAVIEPPAPVITTPIMDEYNEDRGKMDTKERRRTRSKSRERSEKKDRFRKDRRDRSRSRSRDRSRDRRRRDRSRSRERRDRRRDRKDRSRSRDRTPRRSRSDRRSVERRISPPTNQQKDPVPKLLGDKPAAPAFLTGNTQIRPGATPLHLPPPQMVTNTTFPPMTNGPMHQTIPDQNCFVAADSGVMDTLGRIQELGKKRNPNAFQGDQATNGGPRYRAERGGLSRGGSAFRRDGRVSRFEDDHNDCCVAIKNAPNHTSYGDVRRFFPFMIDKHGIKMINDNTGRRTGTIYVRFCESRSRIMALQKTENQLKGAEVQVEPLGDAEYDAAVDSYLPYREDNDDDSSLVIVEPEESKPPPFTVLKVGDLPYYIKEHDIIKVFSDFSLLSIMLNECRNTRKKTAYVQFVKSEDARAALDRKDNYVFGRRPATVVPVTNIEYDKVKSLQMDRPDIESLADDTQSSQESEPPRDPRQRRQLLPEHGAMSAAMPVVMPPNPVGAFYKPPFQPQGYAPSFSNPQFDGFQGGAAVAGGPAHMEPRGGGWTPRPSFAGPAHTPPPAHVSPRLALDDEPQDCILMKGLSSDATDITIVDFLADTGAVPARIHLMLDQQGSPSGDCFCEFRSTQEARRAATKHGLDLNGSRITIDLVARSVVEDALEGPKIVEDHREALLGDRPVMPYFEQPHRGGFIPRGSFRGRGFDRGGFEGRGGYDRGRPFRRGGFDRGRGYEHRGRGRGFGRGRGSFEPAPPRVVHTPQEEESDAALEDFGAPGCVVSMENVPFRATIDDILNFFGDFELTRDDLIRRFNERGMPTGDARVAFRTPADALRAVNMRHMGQIYDRKISLHVV